MLPINFAGHHCLLQAYIALETARKGDGGHGLR